MVISYNKFQNAEIAYQKISEIITEDYIANFKLNATVDYDDKAFQIKGSGKGFDLTLSFLEEGCEVNLNLSLLLRPLKSKMLSFISEMILDAVSSSKFVLNSLI